MKFHNYFSQQVHDLCGFTHCTLYWFENIPRYCGFLCSASYSLWSYYWQLVVYSAVVANGHWLQEGLLFIRRTTNYQKWFGCGQASGTVVTIITNKFNNVHVLPMLQNVQLVSLVRTVHKCVVSARTGQAVTLRTAGVCLDVDLELTDTSVKTVSPHTFLKAYIYFQRPTYSFKDPHTVSKTQMHFQITTQLPKTHMHFQIPTFTLVR